MQSVLADNDAGTNQSNWVFVALLAIVAAYMLGGAQAARRAKDTPFINGAVAAFLAFAVVQAVGIVIRILDDDGISVIALIFNSLLAASIGAVGAWFGVRRGTIDSGGGEPAG